MASQPPDGLNELYSDWKFMLQSESGILDMHFVTSFRPVMCFHVSLVT